MKLNFKYLKSITAGLVVIFSILLSTNSVQAYDTKGTSGYDAVKSSKPVTTQPTIQRTSSPQTKNMQGCSCSRDSDDDPWVCKPAGCGGETGTEYSSAIQRNSGYDLQQSSTVNPGLVNPQQIESQSFPGDQFEEKSFPGDQF